VIKKIPNVFDDLIDAKRILREVKLLWHFQYENIVELVDLVNPLSKADFEDIYMVLEYMETDLHKIIYSKNELSEEHCQYFVYQMLRGLKFIHTANVLHRDLKPSNLLLNANCDLKICDFGLARGYYDKDDGKENDLTEYVVTRWYRAPEIMCCAKKYDAKVDVWSVGCIMAEILRRKPLFPGDNYIHQLNLIFEALGTPDIDDLDWINNEKALKYIKNLKAKPKVALHFMVTEASDEALDLLEKMLVFNPNKRYSVEECLSHPYFEQLHDPEDEPTCPEKFEFEWEANATTKENIQRIFFDEVCKFRSEAEELNPLESD